MIINTPLVADVPQTLHDHVVNLAQADMGVAFNAPVVLTESEQYPGRGIFLVWVKTTEGQWVYVDTDGETHTRDNPMVGKQPA